MELPQAGGTTTCDAISPGCSAAELISLRQEVKMATPSSNATAVRKKFCAELFVF
jgi:hypothetical protein